MSNVLLVEGSGTVAGEITVSGAKNAALPILSATLLVSGVVNLYNIPRLDDVSNLLQLLGVLGAKVLIKDNGQVQLDCTKINSFEAPAKLVATMRASFLVLGPLVARLGKAKVALPGGCAIGSRPVDLHLDGLRKLGATIVVKDGYVEANAVDGLIGAEINLSSPSVTATENIIMAAAFARGVTTISGAAQEPEVIDLINFLRTAGVNIKVVKDGVIVIEGVKALNNGLEYTVMGDRIEAGTFLVAAAITGGDVTVRGISPQFLPLEQLTQIGANITLGDDWLRLDMKKKILKGLSITTGPYPQFPTDLQAQWLVLNVVASGASSVTETIFENRFMHVNELNKMGADLTVIGNKVVISGGEKLTANQVLATDLRASASLVLAGLVADGITKIQNVYHIDRGYEHIELKFSALGCRINRVVK